MLTTGFSLLQVDLQAGVRRGELSPHMLSHTQDLANLTVLSYFLSRPDPPSCTSPATRRSPSTPTTSHTCRMITDIFSMLLQAPQVLLSFFYTYCKHSKRPRICSLGRFSRFRRPRLLSLVSRLGWPLLLSQACDGMAQLSHWACQANNASRGRKMARVRRGLRWKLARRADQATASTKHPLHPTRRG